MISKGHQNIYFQFSVLVPIAGANSVSDLVLSEVFLVTNQVLAYAGRHGGAGECAVPAGEHAAAGLSSGDQAQGSGGEHTHVCMFIKVHWCKYHYL